jgi:hypothetical protein
MAKHTPILFSTEMVQEIIAGRKTQTRRICKVQGDGRGYRQFFKQDFLEDWHGKEMRIPYASGDILCVKEAYYAWGKWVKNGTTETGKTKWRFRDHTITEGGQYLYPDSNLTNMGVAPNSLKDGKFHWYKRSKLFMPKAAYRFFLEVVSVGVVKLNNISEQDAKAEGILSYTTDLEGIRFKDYLADASGYGHPEHDYPTVGLPITSFATLWQSIYGAESWEANPWVWVIEFKRIEKPEGFA